MFSDYRCLEEEVIYSSTSRFHLLTPLLSKLCWRPPMWCGELEASNSHLEKVHLTCFCGNTHTFPVLQLSVTFQKMRLTHLHSFPCMPHYKYRPSTQIRHKSFWYLHQVCCAYISVMMADKYVSNQLCSFFFFLQQNSWLHLSVIQNVWP